MSFIRNAFAVAGIASVLFSGRPALAVDAGLAGKDQVDRTTWVGNAIFHQRPEDLVIAAVLKQLYTQDLQYSPAEALRIANEMRKEYQEQVKSAEGSSTSGQDIQQAAAVLGTISKLIPGAEKFADVIGQAARWEGALYDKTIGPENQIIAQLQNYSKYPSFENPAAVWEDVWLIANSSPEAGTAINAFLRPALNADTHQDSASILELNPGYAANAALLRHAGPDGTIQVTRQALQTGLAQINKSLDELNDHSLQAQSSLDELTLEARLSRKERQETREREARRREDELRLQGQRSSVYVLSTLAGAIDPKLVKPISAVGQAAIQISDDLSKFASRIATNAGTAILTGNILGAVMSLSPLLGGGPSTDELLQQQMQALSLQISGLAKSMKERFDRVDATLGTILTQLGVVLSGLNRIDSRIGAIEESLLRQQAELNQLGADVFTHFTRLLRSEQMNLAERCLERDLYASVRRMSYFEYESCLTGLASYATRTSGQMVNVYAGEGDMRGGENLRTVSFGALAGQLQKTPLDANVELLSRISRDRFGIPLTSEKLSNPVEWAIGSQAYLDLAAAHPEFARLTRLEGVSRILEVGSRIDRTLKNIWTVANVDGPKPNYGFIRLLMETYREAAERLIAQIEASRKKFTSDAVHGIPSGMDLWQDENQAANGSAWGAVNRVKSCDPGFDAELAMPEGLAEAMTPAYLKNASRAKLVSLYFCYETAWSTPTIGSRTHLSTLEMRVVLRVVLKEKDRALLQKSAVSPGFAYEPWKTTVGDPNRLARVAAFPPAVGVYIRQHWEGGVGMKERVGSAATDFASASASQDLTSISETMKSFLDRRRSLFNVRMREDLQGALFESAEELSGIKALIEAYTALGLPRSLRQSDTLRMMFRGKESLLDRKSLIALLNSASGIAQPEALRAELLRRADALERELTRAAEDAPGTQTYPALEATIERLQDMKRDRSRILPKFPISEVFAEIQAKLLDISGKQAGASH